MLLFGLGDGRREVELRPLERRGAVHNERHAFRLFVPWARETE